MVEDDPLLNSPLDAQIRAAHDALRKLLPQEQFEAASDRYLPALVEELPDLADLVHAAAASNLGPTIAWERPDAPGNKWAPAVLQLDLDNLTHEDPAGISHVGDWQRSALALAAHAYCAECRWDYAPGEAGIWLLYVMPYSGIGAHWRGTVAGFAIVHDRDNDDRYESLSHIWTARNWRRRGVAALLIDEARQRFPLRKVEGPLTHGGRTLFERVAPDLLEPADR